MRLFDMKGFTRRELAVLVVSSLAFLLFQYSVVGLITAQVIMVVLFNLLYLSHPVARKVAMAMLPFIAFEISYDWMRLYPNYLVNPVDIRGLYDSELALFGISEGGTNMIPCQYFELHHSVVQDLLAGLFYLCWVPGPIALGLWLLYKGEEQWYVRFALCFLLVNFVGFAGYYIHPAAPPWYALQHGFEPDFSTHGSTAGLARFDELVGLPVFHSIYVNNSNIFAAMPSLHAAYMTVATAYAMLSRRSWPLICLCIVITAGIWWTAVYSCHHYIIDVVMGFFTALMGIYIFERLLMRWSPFHRFIEHYAHCLSQLTN